MYELQVSLKINILKFINCCYMLSPNPPFFFFLQIPVKRYSNYSIFSRQYHLHFQRRKLMP